MKENLAIDVTKASQGIEAYIQKHKRGVIEALQRQKEVVLEFHAIIPCINRRELTNAGANFTGDYW